LLCAAALSAAQAQPSLPAPPPPQGEVKAVVRISKEMIDDVTNKVDVVGAVDYDARILGFRVRGVANGQAKISTEVQPHDSRATIVLHGKGEGQTYARATLGPVLATGGVWAPFTVEALVHFDGRKFSVGEIRPCVDVHVDLDKLEGQHGRLPGRVAGRMMRPVAQMMMPCAETRAVPVGNDCVVRYVDQLGNKIVEKLNGTTRVEESLHRLLPESKDWGFRLSASDNFIQAAYGPAGSESIVLPEHPRRPTTRMEIWLHSSSKGAEAAAKIAKSPLAHQLIDAYLEATLPELAALTDDRSLVAVGPWIVITIGPPKKTK
jgi:hypothetical protein